MTKIFESPIEIIHIIGSLAAGGAERFVIDLLVLLKSRGYSVGLLVLSAKRDRIGDGMSQSLTENGIPFECGPTKRVRFRSLVWYITKLFTINPKVVHLHTENTEVAHYLGCKLYLKSHIVVRTLHTMNNSKNILHKIATKRNIAKISIACSESVNNSFKKIVIGKRVTIHNGVKFDWPIQTTILRKKHQNILNLDNNTFHFVQIGSQNGKTLITSPKAQDVLIRAWRQGKLGSQGCQLNLIGDGELHSQLKRLAGDDSSIVFHGIRDDVHSWLLAANYYVMVSRYEGLPIAGIEAVGSGIPCLFSEIPPLHEIGACEVVWSAVNDVKLLADKLNYVKNTHIKIPIEVTESLRQKYCIEKTGDQYSDCYTQIMRSL